MPGFACALGMLHPAGIALSLEQLPQPCCPSPTSLVLGGCCSLGTLTGKGKPSRSSAAVPSLPTGLSKEPRAGSRGQSWLCRDPCGAHRFGGTRKAVTALQRPL